VWSLQLGHHGLLLSGLLGLWRNFSVMTLFELSLPILAKSFQVLLSLKGKVSALFPFQTVFSPSHPMRKLKAKSEIKYFILITNY
jgi:hypothetical protein